MEKIIRQEMALVSEIILILMILVEFTLTVCKSNLKKNHALLTVAMVMVILF